MYHIIFLLALIGVGIAVLEQPSHWDQNGITYDQKVKVWEADLAREVAQMNKQDSIKELENMNPPYVESLDDDLKDSFQIKDLMKGFKGFL